MNHSRARDLRAAIGRLRAGSWLTNPTLLGPTLLGLLATTAFAACGDMADEGMDSGGGGGDGVAVGVAASTGTQGAVGSGGAPPEEELESSFSAPVATGNFVWIANPASGRVAYIDARSLVVKVVDAGNAPTHLAAIPDPVDDVALVLNVASHDATLLRAKANGELTTRSFAVPATGNRWAVAPSGRWAIAWTDGREIDGADPIDGFQDVVVLDLASAEGGSTPLTVGYRPVAIAFDETSARAFAVTQDGISVIDLDGGAPAVVENVPLSDDPLESTLTRDVAITPDGELALVRRDGDAVVTVHSLSDGTRTDVIMPGPATDLDLSADGTVAVVVVRESGQVALLPIPAIAADPGAFSTFTVTDVVVGSAALAPESPTGFLYTNATPSPVLTVFDTSDEAPEARSILLRAPVSAVFPTPDAAHAIVLHGALPVEGGTGYPASVSLAPIAAQLPPKIIGLDGLPVAIAIAPAGDRAVIAVGNTAVGYHGFVVAQLPSLQADVHLLGSRPIATGIVSAAGRGYVAQEHPDGRITFVDFATGEVRTLTGFELAAQVVDGGVP